MSDAQLPSIRVVSAEIHREGRYLIVQRSAHAVLPLLWEFPGGRVREGESDAEALQRSCEGRIGIRPDVTTKLLETTHDYDSYMVTLVVYRCELPAGARPWAATVEALAWVTPDEFVDYPFPGADQTTVDKLLSAEV